MNARRVAADLGTVHPERVLTAAEVLSALPAVVSVLESCDPALVAGVAPDDALPAQLEPSAGGPHDGKWILRTVAERYLPASVVWRKKEKFASGTGVGPLLEQYANGLELDGDAGDFACAEEQLYWSIFRQRYGRDDVLAGMGRSRSLNERQRWVSGL